MLSAEHRILRAIWHSRFKVRVGEIPSTQVSGDEPVIVSRIHGARHVLVRFQSITRKGVCQLRTRTASTGYIFTQVMTRNTCPIRTGRDCFNYCDDSYSYIRIRLAVIGSSGTKSPAGTKNWIPNGPKIVVCNVHTCMSYGVP